MKLFLYMRSLMLCVLNAENLIISNQTPTANEIEQLWKPHDYKSNTSIQ